MDLSSTQAYERLDTKILGAQSVSAWVSREREDPIWDSFLQTTPLGQFQQSSTWARVKSLQSWVPLRLVLTLNERVVGGFQLLSKSRWWGGFGYVSKGPIVCPGYPEVEEYANELLQYLCRREGLRALVVQPPDFCQRMPPAFTNREFMPDVLADVIEATWLIDLRPGFDAIVSGMRKETRQKVRQASNRGVRIREGKREDVQIFFDLMLSTCRRQGVAPNPPEVSHILDLWDAARPAGCIQLFLAEYEGRPLSGLLCIMFGKTVSLWKRGWTYDESHRHPNDLGIYEVLKWASKSGYHLFDFCALDVEIALALLSNEPLSHEQERSRHLFHIRFGGTAKLLPPARIYFPNPVLRAGYRILFQNKLRRTERYSKSLNQFPHPNEPAPGDQICV
jgi:peptidoglycan pentaglycine glycine transferase (the first glycine)